MTSAERRRLESMAALDEPVREGEWYVWGPYLAERAWGTVREDYSADGDAWRYFPHDQARSRAYRWNEDGMAGLSDAQGRLCLALGLWNERDPILKERMFGLSAPEGNHGEDVKEWWWYLDGVPSSAWLRWRYHYPQAAFPYERLVEENGRRGRDEPEFELLDTGVFDDGRYWVVEVEYAKADPRDIRMRIRARNVGPDPATLHVLPTLWFRNTWSWRPDDPSPLIRVEGDAVAAEHPKVGAYRLEAAPGPDGSRPRWLVCDNETNAERLFGTTSRSAHPKDGIGDHVIHGASTVSPDGRGTKAAAWYRVTAGPGEAVELRLRLVATGDGTGRPEDDPLGAGFDLVMRERAAEADEFYAELAPPGTTAEEASVLRQAFAGMLWGRQFYHYDVATWLDGDPAQPAPPPQRLSGRNHDWRHLDADDVISMPDPWEYPWFATWDLAFHCVTLAHVDAAFAKQQLLLMCREWYMHPNGQLPAYEWSFGDVDPPVHAWAALRVYEIDGSRDRGFLERVFQKLLMNFTWWVNRKDVEGAALFSGGFLGLDNIGPIDRSKLPPGYTLEQADGTGWMAAYCLWMLQMALELARHDAVYQDVATKFFEHFAYIATALDDMDLWDEADGFFYDRLVAPDGSQTVMKVRSIAGLVPLVASAVFDPRHVRRAVGFSARARWFIEHRQGDHPWLGGLTSMGGDRSILAVLSVDRLARVLGDVFDPERFLSPHGIRSLSRWHRDHPFALELDGMTATIDYEPGTSSAAIYGGNSNWRGPVWFPLNVLVLESLLRYRTAVGGALPIGASEGGTSPGDAGDLTGSGGSDHTPSGETGPASAVSSAETGPAPSGEDALADLRERLISLFLRGPDGRRPADGDVDRFRDDPEWRDQVTFYEYFDGDTGRGLGASHQTGWTGLVAHLIVERGRRPAGAPPLASAEEASVSS